MGSRRTDPATEGDDQSGPNGIPVHLLSQSEKQEIPARRETTTSLRSKVYASHMNPCKLFIHVFVKFDNFDLIFN